MVYLCAIEPILTLLWSILMVRMVIMVKEIIATLDGMSASLLASNQVVATFLQLFSLFLYFNQQQLMLGAI